MLVLKVTTLFLITVIGLLNTADAQQIQITPVDETSNNAENEYTIHTAKGEALSVRKYPGALEFLSSRYTVSGFEQISISPGKHMFAFLSREDNSYHAEIFQEDGEQVRSISELEDYDPDDPSPYIYVLDNGEMFFRYNISYFRHYDAKGERLRTINNSSDSRHGEKISDLKVMPNSNAVLLYNARILYSNDQVGSRLRYYDGSGDPATIFTSDNRYIRNISFSRNGQLIILHLVNESTGEHYAKAIDTDGNEYLSLEYEGFEPEELIAGNDGRYLTSRASGRVMVHDMRTGESLGSTSIRGASSLAATYSSAHSSILILSGSLNENRRELSGLELRVVNVAERSINTEEIDGTYSWHDFLNLSIEPVEGNNYRITGMNRELNISL